jgi:gentisate 1,2-dioxygenase
MQMLRANESTLEQRSTAARIFVCLEGSGTTIADGVELNWQRNDVIVVPGWAWSSHRNGSADSVLYSVSDAPALRALGHLVEDRRTRDGEIARSFGEPR